MAGRLEGRVAIVTGAGRGIGRGEALLLAEEGAKVVVNDLGGSEAGEGADASPADQVVTEIVAAGGEAVANYDSVATMEGGERIVQTALDNFGRLDILINNAGILRDRMVFNMTEAEWDSVIAVHLKGHFTTTKHASIVFRQQRSGRIVNTGSEVGAGEHGAGELRGREGRDRGADTHPRARPGPVRRDGERHPSTGGNTPDAFRPSCARRCSVLAPRGRAATAVAVAATLARNRPCRGWTRRRPRWCPTGGLSLHGRGVQRKRPRLRGGRRRSVADDDAHKAGDYPPRGGLGPGLAGAGLPAGHRRRGNEPGSATAANHALATAREDALS